jgi:hypothetical protein
LYRGKKTTITTRPGLMRPIAVRRQKQSVKLTEHLVVF